MEEVNVDFYCSKLMSERSKLLMITLEDTITDNYLSTKLSIKFCYMNIKWNQPLMHYMWMALYNVYDFKLGCLLMSYKLHSVNCLFEIVAVVS